MFEQETVRVSENARVSLDQRQDQQVMRTPVREEERQQNKVMSEMRRHLVQMNRDKMIERGNITAKELAILGKYSNFTDLATVLVS